MNHLSILIATDGEPHSEPAVESAANLAQELPCSLTVLTVVNGEAQKFQGQLVVDTAAARLTKDGLAASTSVAIGQPAAAIVNEATAGQHDIIIMGQRATHGLLARIFGPVTQQVVEQAEQPVLIAKKALAMPRRILLCDSGGSEVPLLDRLIARLPQLLAIAHDVTVLHVMSQIPATPGINGRHLRATAQELIADHSHEGELLQEDIQKLARLSVEPQPLVRHGLVVEEIVAEARQGDYDLVIIGAHQQDSWPRILLDDLAGQIIQHIEQSILVVH